MQYPCQSHHPETLDNHRPCFRGGAKTDKNCYIVTRIVTFLNNYFLKKWHVFDICYLVFYTFFIKKCYNILGKENKHGKSK